MTTATQIREECDTNSPGLPDSAKCVSVIFNPVSGTSDPEQRKKAISDALSRHGYTCQFLATARERTARAIAEEIVRDGADLVVVAGGDGTIMEAMSALAGTQIPIAVIPSGTGNLLSVNLGIPTAVPEAVDVALGGHVYRLDLARSGDGRTFAIMGGMGLDAKLIVDAGRAAKRRLGVLAYFVSAWRNLRRGRIRVGITLDDHPPMLRRVKTVIVANMGRITGGLEAVPNAVPNDGLLDIAVLRVRTPWDWLRLLGAALAGHSKADRQFDVYQARRVRLQALTQQPVQYDGEFAGNHRDITIQIMPGAVGVLLPEDAPSVRQSPFPSIFASPEAARRSWWVHLAILAVVMAGVAWRKRRKR